MKNNLKKLVTVGLTFAMVLGSTFTVFAGDVTTPAETTTDGTSDLAYVNMDVYKIEVPTDAVLQNALTYMADPQNLVLQTQAAAYGLSENAVALEEAAAVNTGIWFRTLSENSTAAGNANTVGISSKSDGYVIKNKSSRGVLLDVAAKMVKGSTTYAGGYSTTSDFSATGDDAKGLYFGLKATNEVEEKALDETGATFKNVALSAADKYEVKYNSGYSYGLKADADNFPTYSFEITGALNHDVADTTWATVANDGTVTEKTLPTIQVKYTPSLIKDKAAVVAEINDATGVVYISKADAEGGFGTTKPTALTINGKDIAAGKIAANEDGYVAVTFDNMCEAYGYTESNVGDLEEDVWTVAKTIQFTANSVDYVVEIPAR
jgi:hypothetical protein